MSSGFALRGLASIAVVLAAALAVFVLSGSAQAAVVSLVGGVAAVLLAPDSESVAFVAVDPASSEPAGLDELLDAVAEPVLLVREGRVELANRAARALLGNHVVGDDVRVAIRHPAAAERLASGAPGTADGPIALVGVGGLDQHWEMRVGVASDDTRIVHLVDTTGTRAAERMRVDFVANASHELRTPLASILGFIETLSDSAGDDPAVRTRFLKVMMDEARRMQRLVEDLISLSRIEADKYRAPSTPVDLAALVEGVCAEVRDAGGDRAQDLACVVVARVAPVAGDVAQLSQLVYNLVGNALKYGRPGTPVTLNLDREGIGWIRLTVTDRGDGIAPEHIPRLTERFYRVDAGRSRALGGTGLGLAIVKHIVERHRGRLDIASRSGEGTTVTVTLPVSPAPASTPAPTPASTMSQNRNADAAGRLV